jgi:CopG family nickel-responsive transcriptional regulator
MTVITISIPEKLLENIDKSIKDRGFASRSEIIRQATRAYLKKDANLRELEGEIVSTITIIYKRKVARSEVSDIQHRYGNIISTFLHAHIDESYCLEVIVVKGLGSVVRKLVDALKSNEEITQIKVAIVKESIF